MEEKKLLFVLKILGRIFCLLTLLGANYSLADDNQPNPQHLNLEDLKLSDDDKNWAADLSDQAINMVWTDLLEKFNQQQLLESQLNPSNQLNGVDQLPANQRVSGLYIFVSHSMPKPLLKSYLKEATKYGGVLVFKGLPNGSFKELGKLIIELTDNANINNEANIDLTAGLQIDDQAFEQYQVTSVPTIVLVNIPEYSPNQTSQIIYDKMVGNCGIKYALEQFSRSGELYQQASEYLNNRNSNVSK